MLSEVIDALQGGPNSVQVHLELVTPKEEMWENLVTSSVFCHDAKSHEIKTSS